MIKITVDEQISSKRFNVGDEAAVAARRVMKRPIAAVHPIIVAIELWFARPKSHFTTGSGAKTMEAKRFTRPIRKPSATDMAEIVVEALDGIAWENTGQIVDILIHKRYADDPEDSRVVVNIFQSEDYEFKMIMTKMES